MLMDVKPSAERVVGYIANRTHSRIAEGMSAGEAALDALATVDENTYVKVLGDKKFNNLRLAGEAELTEFWEFLIKHYSDPKNL